MTVRNLVLTTLFEISRKEKVLKFAVLSIVTYLRNSRKILYLDKRVISLWYYASLLRQFLKILKFYRTGLKEVRSHLMVI